MSGGMTLRRILLLCGILSPILYAIADTLAGLQWASYSFRDQTISELGAIGAPSRQLFSFLLIPTYLLFIVFGVGVWQSAVGRRKLKIAAGLLIAFGIIAIIAGPFVSMQLRGTEQGLAGALHLIEGGVEMLILLTALGFASGAIDHKFRLYTIFTIVLMLIFGAWSGMDAPLVEAGLPTPWLGVKERIMWYSYHLWFIVLSIRLLQQRTIESGEHGN
jgi:hypothetical membrane protein